MTHYEEFGLASNATPDQIRHAHRNLARLLHPDHIQDEALRAVAECQMKRVNAVYSVLMDPSRRRMYDLQALPGLDMVPVGAPDPSGPREGAGGNRGWADRLAESARWPGGPWLMALVVLGVALGSLVQPLERVVYVERPSLQARSAQPGPKDKDKDVRPAGNLGARQLAEEARELRRLLQQAVAERDHAMGRSYPSRPAASASPVPGPPVSSPLVAVAGASISQPALTTTTAPAEQPAPASPVAPATPHAPESQPLSAVSQARPRLGGTWIYAPTGNRAASEEQYPADYIELVLDEREGRLWGRYRARYRVTDRALSPDVEFFFEGDAAPASAIRYPWRGSGGSRGELQLRLMSENTLSVGWFTSQLGRVPSLGSGSAVLIRRQDRNP